MVVLSKRLAQIAENVPSGSKLADIGSDHALLPVFLAQKGIIVSAVAGELNPGPYAAAVKQVVEAELQDIIAVRQGDGLAVIEPGEANVITIAGMGGQLIVQILTQGISKLGNVTRLVLQPNVGEEAVRRWLVAHGWFLTAEYILQEDGKTYEVLTAERVEDADHLNRTLFEDKNVSGTLIHSDLFYAMGPYLLQQADPIWIRKWQDELLKLQRVVEQLSQSQQTSAIDRQQEIRHVIAEVKEVLACLQKAKR
jgi:tRNA (adenine22-N1)-methyltransferase